MRHHDKLFDCMRAVQVLCPAQPKHGHDLCPSYVFLFMVRLMRYISDQHEQVTIDGVNVISKDWHVDEKKAL